MRAKRANGSRARRLRVPQGRNVPPWRDGRNFVNELTQRTIGEDPAISLTYDDAGNLTQDGDSDGDHKYAWDYRNRLIEVEEKQSGNWVTIAEYTYDATNRRVVKEVTNKGSLNGTTHYIWGAMTLSADGGGVAWQCLQERDGSGDLVAQYTYAPGYIDSPARQQRDLNDDGDFGDTNEVVWYHSNTLHSVYALTANSESVVERYRYDAYGAATVLDADGSDDADGASDVDNPYLFTGRRLDAETELMHYRFRQYSAVLGRFIGRDPIGYVGGWCLYGGRFGRRFVDPFGLKWVLESTEPERRMVGDYYEKTEEDIIYVAGEDECGNEICKVYRVTYRVIYRTTALFSVKTYRWHKQGAADGICKSLGGTCALQALNPLSYFWPPWGTGSAIVGCCSWIGALCAPNWYATEKTKVEDERIPDSEREERLGVFPKGDGTWQRIGTLEGPCPED